MSDYPIDIGLGDLFETCPRHPDQPVNGCKGCETDGERRLDARAAAPAEHDRTPERLHERWLDRIGGSR